MKSRRISSSPDACVVVFDAGDELPQAFNEFVRERNLSASSFRAIGALSSVKLGWYNPEAKQYDTAVELKEQLELLSLTGDVAQMSGEPIVHSHAVIGRRDGSTVGGHLMRAIVSPTCELFLVEYPKGLVKEYDDRFNLICSSSEVALGPGRQPSQV